MAGLVLHKEYSPLFGTDKNGKTRVWQASVFTESPQKTISVIQHGTYGGKLQNDRREYTEGKNIGKKNETTPLEQCVLEVEKKIRDKIEKESYTGKYSGCFAGGIRSNSGELCSQEFDVFPSRTEFHNSARNPKVFPMLANKYEPGTQKKQGIVYPCYVQPKLDGLRCVVYMGEQGEPVYQSRTGGEFTVLQHLDPCLNRLFEKTNNTQQRIILDGELYTSQIPFEELAGIIKKKKLNDADRSKITEIKYHVYDIIVPEVPYKDRLSSLQNILSPGYDSLVEVPTYSVADASQFREKFGEFVEAGYEGIMLRNEAGLYRENYRSNDLMKYKEFFESEYPIVGYREATGRDSGTVIWECDTPEGRRFCVRPRGTQEARREWFKRASSHIGKKLTVIYQELSEMGVPRFPVGKAIRDGY